MRARGVCFVVVLLAAGAPSLVGVSALARDCGGDSDRRGRSIHCEVEHGPVPGGGAGGASASRLPQGWTVEVRDTFGFGLHPGAGPEGPYPCDPDTGEEISSDGLADDPGAWPGRFGILSIRDAEGATVVFELLCLGETTGIPTWFPPTRGEIERALEEAPWPPSVTGVDPRVEGLTGLETWLWSETLDARPISLTVANATVIGTATPVAYRWQMGDGAIAHASAAGSPGEPAATHVYDVKGSYEIVLEIEWQADVEVVVALPSGGELRFRQDPPLSPVTVAGSRDYQVVEVRSILVPNRD